MLCKSNSDKRRGRGSNGEDDEDGPNGAFMDVIQQTVGGFGRWQWQIFALLCIIALPNTWTEMSIQLLGHSTEFWCKPPELYQNMSTAEWKALISVTHENSNKVKVGSCMILDILNENVTSLIPCEWGYEYNREYVVSNIITEWNFVCDREYLVYVFQILTMISLSLGGLCFGFAADRFGRSRSLLLAIVCRSIFGILSSAARHYHLFFFLRICLAFFDRGALIIGLVMCLEIVAGRWKIIVPILYQLSVAFGLIIMSIMTNFIRDWRIAQAALYFMSAICIICHRIVPESPKWLLAVGRDADATKILENAGELNNVDSLVVRSMVQSFYISPDDTGTPKFIDLLKNVHLRKRLALGCLNGFIIFTVLYGLSRYLGQLSVNPYLNICLQGVLTLVGILFSVGLVILSNRKLAIVIASSCCGVFTLSLLAIPLDMTDLRGVIGGMAYIASIVCISPIQPLVAELFPTAIRNSAYGIFSIFMSIGALIAPFIISFGDIIWYLPLVIVGVLSLIEAVVIVYLPENPRHALPQTLEEIEMYSFA
ncbi:hypothetical protein RI129_001985 [Pyrocoelia pectoralis]|uniref:Major facilitator superfamily (MFS) profile domain-containing protein n=1 Tax=Pyrocoelia pectoralis TaxID=417401 RepID=A0AAN7VW38_9COLE